MTRMTRRNPALRSRRSHRLFTLGVILPAAFSSATGHTYVYQCDKNDTHCVTNYNTDLQKNLGQKDIKVFRVVMPKSQTADLGEIKNNANSLIRFYHDASRGQLNMKLVGAETLEIERGNCHNVQNQALKMAADNAFINVFALPTEACDYSHSGAKDVFLDGGGLFRDYAHEAGHSIGLGHGNKNMNGFESYGDPSTYMGRYPADNYSAPQLHFLGWTKKEEVVKINADIDNGGEIEVKLRPVDRNTDDSSDIPLTYVYEKGDSRLFVAIPKSTDSGVNSINGGEVFIYRTSKCKDGCGDTVVGRIFDLKKVVANGKTYHVDDLAITPVSYDVERVARDGKRIEKFNSVTLRIGKSVN